MDKTSLKYKGRREAKLMRNIFKTHLSVFVGLCVMEAGLASFRLKLHEMKREQDFSVNLSFPLIGWIGVIIGLSFPWRN